MGVWELARVGPYVGPVSLGDSFISLPAAPPSPRLNKRSAPSGIQAGGRFCLNLCGYAIHKENVSCVRSGAFWLWCHGDTWERGLCYLVLHPVLSGATPYAIWCYTLCYLVLHPVLSGAIPRSSAALPPVICCPTRCRSAPASYRQLKQPRFGVIINPVLGLFCLWPLRIASTKTVLFAVPKKSCYSDTPTNTPATHHQNEKTQISIGRSGFLFWVVLTLFLLGRFDLIRAVLALLLCWVVSTLFG